MAFDELQANPPEGSEGSTFDENSSVVKTAVGVLTRCILNVFAGGMIFLGYGNKEIWEHIVAFGVIIATLSWSALTDRRRRNKQKQQLRQTRRKYEQNPPRRRNQ